MIRLENVNKTFVLNGRHKTVAKDICATFETGTSVAILGRNGAGKSSLLRMIAGTLNPDRGKIVSDGSISWPVGFGGTSHPELTGVQNTRFVGRIYGVDTDELVDFVADFAALGSHFNLPVRSYSSGMRSRLAFGISMGIDFDTYLVDEITAVGDAAFKSKSEALFAERVKSRSAIVVSHSVGQVRRLCDKAAVLENGKLSFHDDVEEALSIHRDTMHKK